MKIKLKLSESQMAQASFYGTDGFLSTLLGIPIAEVKLLLSGQEVIVEEEVVPLFNSNMLSHISEETNRRLIRIAMVALSNRLRGTVRNGNYGQEMGHAMAEILAIINGEIRFYT